MKNLNPKEQLLAIRASLLNNSAVVDTMWMKDTDETVVEAIDGLLIDLGLTADEVDKLDI